MLAPPQTWPIRCAKPCSVGSANSSRAGTGKEGGGVIPPPAANLADPLREAVQRRFREQFAGGDGMAKYLFEAVRHCNSQQAVTAEGEEVIVAMDCAGAVA